MELQLWSGLGLMYKLSTVIPWFKKVAVGELTSPRVIQSATWLTASWFVGELSCKHVNDVIFKHPFCILPKLNLFAFVKLYLHIHMKLLQVMCVVVQLHNTSLAAASYACSMKLV